MRAMSLFCRMASGSVITDRRAIVEPTTTNHQGSPVRECTLIKNCSAEWTATHGLKFGLRPIAVVLSPLPFGPLRSSPFEVNSGLSGVRTPFLPTRLVPLLHTAYSVLKYRQVCMPIPPYTRPPLIMRDMKY